jgi:hypothetical protein
MKRWRSLLIIAGLIVCAISAEAQQSAPPSSKPKSSGEIAKASQVLAQKNENWPASSASGKVDWSKTLSLHSGLPQEID